VPRCQMDVVKPIGYIQLDDVDGAQTGVASYDLSEELVECPAKLKREMLGQWDCLPIDAGVCVVHDCLGLPVLLGHHSQQA